MPPPSAKADDLQPAHGLGRAVGLPAWAAVSAAPGLDMGHVDKLIALATKPSTHPPLAHLSLADLACLRLEKRANPTYSSLEEFFYIRGSCHLIEEIQGDFYCDCRDGIKGHI